MLFVNRRFICRYFVFIRLRDRDGNMKHKMITYVLRFYIITAVVLRLSLCKKA